MSARLILVTVLAVAIAAPLAAQQVQLSPPEVENARNSFIGQTNTAGVLVRSGPGDNYYPTMRLDKGAELTVVGIRFDWLKIVPPEGTMCYVSKLFVDRYGDGSAGRINADDVNIRVGSSIVNQKTAVVGKLSAGQDVKILGEEDEYFRIVPPANTYVYVNRKFVDPVRALGPVAVSEPRGRTRAPQDQGGQTAGPASTQPVQPPSTQEAAVAEAEAKLEQLLQSEKALATSAWEQVPVEQLLADYKALADGGLLPAAKQAIVADRLAKLPALLERKQRSQASEKASRDAADKLKTLAAEGDELSERLKDGPKTYVAIGELQVSTVQLGGGQLFRLVDPESKRTVCYLRGDPQKMGATGRLVAVNGSQSTDRRLGDRMKLVDATEVVEVDRTQLYEKVVAEMMPVSLRRTEAQVSTENR